MANLPFSGLESFLIKDERDKPTSSIAEHEGSPQYCLVFKTRLVSKVPDLTQGVPVRSGKSVYVEFVNPWTPKERTASKFCRPDELFPDYLEFITSLPHRPAVRTNAQHPLPIGTVVLVKEGKFRILGKILALQRQSMYAVLPLTCRVVSHIAKPAVYDDVEPVYRDSALKKIRKNGDWVVPVDTGEMTIQKDTAERDIDSMMARRNALTTSTNSASPLQQGQPMSQVPSGLHQISTGGGLQVSTRGGLIQPLVSSVSGALLHNPPHSAGFVHGGLPYNHAVGGGPAATNRQVVPSSYTPGRPLLPKPSQAASVPSSQNASGPMLRDKPYHPPDATRSSSRGVNYGSMAAPRDRDSRTSNLGAAGTQQRILTQPQAPQHWGHSAATTSSTALTGDARLNGNSSAHDLSPVSAGSSFPTHYQNFSAAMIPAGNTHAFPTPHGLPNLSMPLPQPATGGVEIPRIRITPGEVIDLTQDSPTRTRVALQNEGNTQTASRSEDREPQRSEEFPTSKKATAQEPGEAQAGTQRQKRKRKDSEGSPVSKQTADPKANDRQVDDMEMDETQVDGAQVDGAQVEDTQVNNMQVNDPQVDDSQPVETAQEPNDQGKRKISEEASMPVQAAPNQPTKDQKGKGKSRAKEPDTTTSGAPKQEPKKSKKAKDKSDAHKTEDDKYQVFPDPLNIRRPRCPNPNCGVVFCHCGLKKQWCKCVCWSCGGRWNN